MTTKRRQRTDRGASLVEAAIVMIPLCILVFGIIEFGFAFKDILTLSNAGRAGARVASAEPGDGNFLADTLKATQTAGTAVSFSTGDTICIYQVRNGPNASPKINPTGKAPANCSGNAVLYTYSSGHFNGSTTTNIFSNYNGAQLGPDVCAGDANADSIGVALSYKHHSISGFFPDISMNEHTVMRLEPQVNANTCPGATS